MWLTKRAIVPIANLLDPAVIGGSDLSPFVESLKSNKILSTWAVHKASESVPLPSQSIHSEGIYLLPCLQFMKICLDLSYFKNHLGLISWSFDFGKNCYKIWNQCNFVIGICRRCSSSEDQRSAHRRHHRQYQEIMHICCMYSIGMEFVFFTGNGIGLLRP